MIRDSVGDDTYNIFVTYNFGTFLAGFITTAWQIKVSFIGLKNLLMSYNSRELKRPLRIVLCMGSLYNLINVLVPLSASLQS